MIELSKDNFIIYLKGKNICVKGGTFLIQKAYTRKIFKIYNMI